MRNASPSPGESDGSDGRSLRAYVDAHVGEVRAERCFHLGLDIARQMPSAGLGAQINLEGIDAGMALNGRFHLHRAGLSAHCTGVDGDKGERASVKNALQYAAPRAPLTARDGQNPGNPNGR